MHILAVSKNQKPRLNALNGVFDFSEWYSVETEGFEPSSRTGKPCAFYMLILRLIVGPG